MIQLITKTKEEMAQTSEYDHLQHLLKQEKVNTTSIDVTTINADEEEYHFSYTEGFSYSPTQTEEEMEAEVWDEIMDPINHDPNNFYYELSDDFIREFDRACARYAAAFFGGMLSDFKKLKADFKFKDGEIDMNVLSAEVCI